MNDQTTAHSVAHPVVLVTGATGSQGGSVARHLLARGHFGVRALTRSPNSPAAETLRALGAEIVAGDLGDPRSLRTALAGVHGVFGVTSGREDPEGEYQRGANLIDAVRDSHVAHLVLSTLPHVRKATMGRLAVPRFDRKARIREYADSQSLPVTYVQFAQPFERFLAELAPRRQPDGRWHLALPLGETPLAGIAEADAGGLVSLIFERRDDFVGRTLHLAGDELRPREYAAAMARATGHPVEYTHVSRDAFAAHLLSASDEVADTFEYYRVHVPSRRDDIFVGRLMYPALQRFETWAVRHATRLAEALAA